MHIGAVKQANQVLEGVDLFIVHLIDLHAIHQGKEYVSIATVTTNGPAEPAQLQRAFAAEAAALRKTGGTFFVVGIVQPDKWTTVYCLMAEKPPAN